MHGQLRALSALHDVTVLAIAEDEPAQRSAARQLVESGVDLTCVWRPAKASSRRMVDRTRLAGRWLTGDEPLRSLAFHRREMQLLIDRILRERQIDLVQIEDNAMATYRFSPALPRVLTEHEVRDPECGVSPDRSSPFLARFHEAQRWIRYQRRVWSSCHRIQVFTERDAASILRIAPHVSETVRVNPFGVEIPGAADPSREVPGTIVFVGGFLHQPNVDAACWLVNSIMPVLRRHVPGIRLTIVGSDPTPRVRGLATDDVEVTGRVPDVEPYLERASVVVAPIRLGGGMRLKVLQAMALGKSVVTTSLGAEGLLGNAERPFSVADDEMSFARQVSALLQDASYRRDLGNRARSYVAKHYTWDAYGRRLGDLYEDLLSRQSGRDRSRIVSARFDQQGVTS